jgi:S1-C subfamily serine protease
MVDVFRCGLVRDDVSPFYLHRCQGPADLEGLVVAFGKGEMRVETVAEGSQSAMTGLQAGDVVLAVDGRPIRNTRE